MSDLLKSDFMFWIYAFGGVAFCLLGIVAMMSAMANNAAVVSRRINLQRLQDELEKEFRPVSRPASTQ